jgi:hypothetical protein
VEPPRQPVVPHCLPEHSSKRRCSFTSAPIPIPNQRATGTGSTDFVWTRFPEPRSTLAVSPVPLTSPGAASAFALDKESGALTLMKTRPSQEPKVGEYARTVQGGTEAGLSLCGYFPMPTLAFVSFVPWPSGRGFNRQPLPLDPIPANRAGRPISFLQNLTSTTRTPREHGQKGTFLLCQQGDISILPSHGPVGA